MTAINHTPLVIIEDYRSPAAEPAEKETDTASADDLMDSFVLLEQDNLNHLKGWVETEPDAPSTATNADAPSLEPEARARGADSEQAAEQEQDAHEQGSSWMSLLTRPLHDLYSAAANLGQIILGGEATNAASQPATLAEQNLRRALDLADHIEAKLHHMDTRICAITGSKMLAPLAGRLDTPELSTWDTIQNFSARTQGTVTSVLDATIGVATGVAIGGVATTGILGLGLGATALSGGTILALKNLRDAPNNANNQAVINIIRDSLPGIQKDLAELSALMNQEQHRQHVAQRIMVTTALRYEHCSALDRSIKAMEKELHARRTNAINAEPPSEDSPKPVSAQQVALAEIAPADDTQRRSVLSTLAQTRDALYEVLNAIIEVFTRLRDQLFFTLNSSEAATISTSDKNAEDAFKKTFEPMLQDLARYHIRTLDSGAHVIALQDLKRGNSESPLTSQALLTDIRIGQNLTRTILSAERNFGAVKYTANEGAQPRPYAVPSNLTTVRAIARYLDAQSSSNMRSPALASSAPDIAQQIDGTITIADPDSKLFSFLAGAPSAYANFLTEADIAVNADPLDSHIGRMTITDYSSSFPGGANQMEFEGIVDSKGNQFLAVRFSTVDKVTMSRPDSATLDTMLRNLADKIVLNEAPDETFDYSKMSDQEIWTQLDKLNQACDAQITLIKEDQRQIAALNQWQNPLYLQRA